MSAGMGVGVGGWVGGGMDRKGSMHDAQVSLAPLRYFLMLHKIVSLLLLKFLKLNNTASPQLSKNIQAC